MSCMLTEWLERGELKTTVVWHADWYSKRHKTAASLIEDSYKSFIQVFHGLSINILLTSCHEILLGNLNAGLFRDTKHIFNRKNKMYLQKYSAETRYTFPIPLTCGSSQCAPCEVLQLLNHCLAQNIEYFIPYLNIWSGMYVKVKWHLNKSCGSVSQVGWGEAIRWSPGSASQPQWCSGQRWRRHRAPSPLPTLWAPLWGRQGQANGWSQAQGSRQMMRWLVVEPFASAK